MFFMFFLSHHRTNRNLRFFRRLRFIARCSLRRRAKEGCVEVELVLRAKEDEVVRLTTALAAENGRSSALERQLYGAPGFDAAALVQRLLTKRPLAFLCSSDSFLLRDGVTSGYGGFEAVGTDAQRPSLALADYMSYDEIGLAALLGVSCPTHFVNSGDRGNCGAHGAPGSFEQRGVYVGLVGARFEKCRNGQVAGLVHLG